MKTKLTIASFIGMLVLFAVILVCPADKESVLNENREPASMPKATFENLFEIAPTDEGNFFKMFETYLSDNVGFRGALISISDKVNSLKGINIYGSISNVNGDLGMGNASTDKSLLTVNGKIMEVFKENPVARDNYVAMVNHYAEKLPKDIELYSMIIPTQLEFEKKDFSSLQDSQKETIDYIYKNVAGRAKCVDAYGVLKKHSNEYIYFKSDHHWTTRGAYYAYTAFGDTAGFKPANIKDFKENKADNFLGYLFDQAGKPQDILKKPDTIYYYTNGVNLKVQATAWEEGKVVNYEGRVFKIPASGETTRYDIFMSGDHPQLVVSTEVKNGKTLLIVKDSYANAFMPWVVNNFEKVVAIDPRSFKGELNVLLKEEKVTDVLLMNYVFTTTFDDFIAVEKGLLK